MRRVMVHSGCVDGAHVVFEHANINSDACIAELLHATSRNLRVWINCSDNDALDACINNCLRAWASAPSVAAWFKCAEQSCACCIFSGGTQRNDFGM